MLFCTRNPLVFTPTHRLAKEMRARGVQAQTYHSFFRYSGVKHARATKEDLVLLQSKPVYLGKTLKVFRAETNWEASEDLLLEIDSNVAPGLDLDRDEIPAEEVAFVSREEGGLLHYPGSGKLGPQIADTEWSPKKMGQKMVPRVCIWEEVCTVPLPTLEIFLDWLEGRGVQVVCCGDQGQPPPIAGEMAGSAGMPPTIKRSR